MDLDMLRDTFRPEAYELLAELESALLVVEEYPEDKDAINRVFRALHTIKGSGGAVGFDVMARLAHSVENLYAAIRNEQMVVTHELIDLTLAARDQLLALLEEHYSRKPADPARTEELIGKLNALLLQGTRDGKRGAPGPAPASSGNGQAAGGAALDLFEQQHVHDHRNEHAKADESDSIRVQCRKLDTLMDLVGELVTVQARLTRTAEQGRDPLLGSIAEEVERLTAELRDNAMSIRMLPIGSMFSTFKRLVRDLSQSLGKEVELATEGAETELDKTVIERLHDPLVHLIRNSIDHGIERPDARASSGKPRHGVVRLSAVHSGSHVLIRIQDDGKGIDLEAVRARALERGLIAPDAALTEKDLYALIFAPGFSTASAVSDVSGRGVGLDVVKQAIDALRGVVEIESARGRGTTITLSLPLTLAIIDGFLTRIGDGFYVFPLSLVSECAEFTSDLYGKTRCSDLLSVRGALVPYVRLRDCFNINGSPPPAEQVVITKLDGGLVGFVVDQVLGDHQTVIKNLGTMYRNVDGISGATILGDGGIALILDIPKLVQSAGHKGAIS
jgi:two-component system chemotaxis sensor kinase CheA